MRNNKKNTDGITAKVILKFVAFIVLSLLIVSFVVFYLILQDDNKHVKAKDSSNDLIEKITYSALFEKEVLIKSEEINGFMSKQISQEDKENHIKAIIIKTDKNSSVINIYIRYEFHGFYLGCTFDIQVNLKEHGLIEFDILKAKIGKLPVTRKFATDIMKKVMKNRIEVQDTKVLTQSVFLINEFNREIKITIDKIEIKQGNFILKFSGVKNVIERFLKDSLLKVFS